MFGRNNAILGAAKKSVQDLHSCKQTTQTDFQNKQITQIDFQNNNTLTNLSGATNNFQTEEQENQSRCCLLI